MMAALTRNASCLRGLLLGSLALLFAASCQNDRKSLVGPALKAKAHVPSFATVQSTNGATFTTDKDDYSPGETLNLSGTGWPLNDVLDIHLDETPQNHAPLDWIATVDGSGSFTDATYVVQESDLGVTFTITATSRATGDVAQATFTDAPPPDQTAGSLCAEVTGHGATVCSGLANDPAGVLGTGETHYAQVVGSTVDYEIIWPAAQATNYLAGDGANGCAVGEVLVQIHSEVLGNQTECGTLITSQIIHFSWTAPKDGCQTTTVFYRSGTKPNGDPEFIGADNDILANDNDNGTPHAAAGIGYTSSSAPTTANVCGGGGGEAGKPAIIKDAKGSYTNTYTWTIEKTVDKTLVEQFGGGTATFNYTVTVTHNTGTISAVKVEGTISVTNPNPASIDITGVTDQLSNSTNCSVTGGGAQTLTAGQTKDFTYECDLTTATSVPEGLSNTATVNWSTQTLSNGGTLSAGSSATDPVAVSFIGTTVDGSVNVTDTFNGTPGLLGTMSFSDGSPKDFPYSRQITIPTFDCKKYDNTATLSDAPTSASKTVTVEVCGPAKTGALTMGYWVNKNGQAIIKGQASSGVCPSGTWLRTYAPFQDLSATATCTTVASYVTTVIKGANASGASMNAMLKGQMLATALDVYFSDGSLGGNRIGAPAPVGGVTIDLTVVCATVINPTPSTAACSGGITENAGPAFLGATSKTVSDILAYAASQSNSGGSAWYGQVKTTQELAKDTFDAINNQLAFAP